MASRGSSLELSSERLPRELLALYLVAPLVTTPVLSGDFFRLAPADMVRELVANCVAFLTIPPALHQMYRRVMPRLLARRASFAQRLAVHVAMTGAATACVALEERLRGCGFVRVHRGELVALAAIESLGADDSGHLVRLRDGQVARVSRRLVSALKAQLGL